MNNLQKIQKAIDKLNKARGNKVAFTGSYIEPLVPLSTGIEALDEATGIGGLPVGRITEFHGLPGSAKTSVCLHIIAQAQKAGKTCMFIDAEHALDIEHARSLGVDLENLIIIQPYSGEEAFEVIEQMVKEGLVQLVVVDSVPSLNPTPELEAEFNKPTMGGQARMITGALRRLVPLFSKKHATLLLINQMRVNIMGGQYQPYTIPGGMALQFYCSLRVKLHKKADIKSGDKLAGIQISYNVIKNKCSERRDYGYFNYIFDKGFESMINVLEAGVNAEIIDKDGANYSYKGRKLAYGKEKALAEINSDFELLNRIRVDLQLPPMSSEAFSLLTQSVEPHSEPPSQDQ
jgi:recombination protein RecA